MSFSNNKSYFFFNTGIFFLVIKKNTGYIMEQLKEKTINFFLKITKVSKTKIINNKIVQLIKNKIEKLNSLINDKLPNLHSFCLDLINLCKKHKNFIGRCFKYYIYIASLLYFIASSFAVIVGCYELESLIDTAQSLIDIYRFGTLPIGRQRFILRYICYIPLKIVEYFLTMLIHIENEYTRGIYGYGKCNFKK